MDQLVSTLLYLSLGGVGGYLIQHYLGRRAERERQLLEKKRDKYQNLVRRSKGFVEGSSNKEDKRLFIEELSECWLYASDQVIRCANNFLQEFVKARREGQAIDPEIGRQKLADMVLAMRKDLEYRKTQLTTEDYKLVKLIDD